jgi:hypothetical protein
MLSYPEMHPGDSGLFDFLVGQVGVDIILDLVFELVLELLIP